MPGVGTVREYRRYYPAGEVTGHVIGFTDVDDRGQEGLEAAFDHWLKGESGSKRVLQDRRGQVIRDVELLQAARPGRDLRTSIDLRIQYLAYRELKAAVTDSRALSGSVVVLDPRTGEVLAMVNQPSYNPNDRSQYRPENYRNRAVTDIFEPGSSFKPLVMAAALESGAYNPRSIIDTSPGSISINDRIITEDKSKFGRIDLTTVLAQVEQRRRRARRVDDGAASDCRRARAVRDRPAHRQRVPRRDRPACSTTPSIGARSARRRCPMVMEWPSRRCSSRAPTLRSQPTARCGPCRCSRWTRPPRVSA